MAAAAWLGGGGLFAGCGHGRTQPTAAPVDFMVGVFPPTMTAAQLQPVLSAFNAQHAKLRASFGALVAGGTYNPALSCLLGLDLNGFDPLSAFDLGPTMRSTNFDASALLPGLLSAATGPAGIVYGMPINFSITALQYDAKALSAAEWSPPPVGGWTDTQLLAVTAALATSAPRSAAFGGGLATFDLGGNGPVWLGFAEGYGGTVVSGTQVNLTSGAVYEGLTAYADILALTWVGPSDKASSGDTLGFTVWGKPPTVFNFVQHEIARFPVMPTVSAVPAFVTLAQVPGPVPRSSAGAPQPEAGALFAVWCGTPAGQVALTGIGYPSVLRQGVGSNTSWLQKDKTGVVAADLRFEPGVWTHASNATGTGGVPPLDNWITSSLALPKADRLENLKVIETVASALLTGEMTQGQAFASLTRAGLPH